MAPGVCVCGVETIDCFVKSLNELAIQIYLKCKALSLTTTMRYLHFDIILTESRKSQLLFARFFR